MVAEHDNAVHEVEEEEAMDMDASSSSNSVLTTVLKLAAASAFLYSAISTIYSSTGTGNASPMLGATRRQLSSAVGDTVPSYMEPLMKDLRERVKLFADTPPEEVKYWFEYAGPLQVSDTGTSWGSSTRSIPLARCLPWTCRRIV
jgi:hypothetical protein